MSVRYTFVGLITYVDDAGRGRDNARLIKAELYPLDERMTPRAVDSHLATIAENGPLCRYEAQGNRYLHLVHWSEHQRINRPSPSLIPPCPLHDKDVSIHGALTEDSVNDHGLFSEVAKTDSLNDHGALTEDSRQERKGKEGKGKERTTSAPPMKAKEQFELFYAAYPRHEGRAEAARKWDLAVRRGVDPELIITGATAFAKRRRGEDPKFTPLPASWLHQGRWDDEPAPTRPEPTPWNGLA